MKCLHVLPMNSMSGAERLAFILCKNIEKYKVSVVCGGDILKSKFEESGIETYSIEFSDNKIWTNIKELNLIIKKSKSKLIHAHDNSASVLAYLTKKIYRLDIKIISHVHSCYPWIYGTGLKKIIDSYFRPKYDYNILCGEVVEEFYKKNTNYIDSCKFESLSNCIDLNEISTVDQSKFEEIYLKYNIPKSKTVIGYVGRLVELKGLDPFIRAIHYNKENFINNIILIVGSGDQENHLKNLIKELQLEDIFIFTGQQDSIYEFYKVMDIIVLPSKYEGLPMCLLEAMALAKPIVAMDVGSISEIVKNKYNGYLVENGDYNQFVKCLNILSKDDEMKIKYGESSFEHVNTYYNIKSYVPKIMNIYENIK